MRQAHRPEPRWRWYLGLAAETAVLLTLIVVVVFFTGMAQ
jgi:hypothetical protein